MVPPANTTHFYGGAHHTMTREEEETWASRIQARRLGFCAGNDDTCPNTVPMNVNGNLCELHKRNLRVGTEVAV